jgi:hypothetical protein
MYSLCIIFYKACLDFKCYFDYLYILYYIIYTYKFIVIKQYIHLIINLTYLVYVIIVKKVLTKLLINNFKV